MAFRQYESGEALPDDPVALNAVYASLAAYLNQNVGQQLQYKDLMNRILVKAMGAAQAAPASARPIYQPAIVSNAAPSDDAPPAYPGTTGPKKHRQPPTLENSDFAISGSAKNLRK